MLKFTTTKKWTILAVICAGVLAVSLLFAGCGTDNSSNINADRTVNNNTSTTIDKSINSSMIFADGGSSQVTNGVATATANDGYEFGYWTRTKDSVTVKYATDDSVTVGTGETFSPVFVATDNITYVDNETALKTAMTNNANIKLVADITTSSTFTPVTTFSGILDGAGYKITVSYTSSDSVVGGLCGTLTGVIKNLKLDGKIINSGTSSTQVAGAFAGSINGGLISNCANYCSVTCKTGYAGSFVAQATNTIVRGSTINGCANYGSVLGMYAGAIIYTNGTTASPLTNLVENENTGSIQTVSISA